MFIFYPNSEHDNQTHSNFEHKKPMHPFFGNFLNTKGMPSIFLNGKTESTQILSIT